MKLHLITLAALATLAGCSTLPERNASLDQARAQHAAASSDATIARLAADEWREAGSALRRAESAQAADADRAEVDHLAYLARQRLVIAQETADARSAQAVTTGAGAERDRLRLSMRTAEADAAQRGLAAATAAGERQSAELAAAGRAAMADRARLASRDARVDDLEQALQALNARRTERGMVVTLGDVLFDTGQSRLRAGGGSGMQQLADLMQRHPALQASIEGHTDDVGSEASNQALSSRRARSVVAALVGLGVDPGRLAVHGYGETRPVDENTSAAGRQMNRRVEIVFAPTMGPVSGR